MFEKWPVWLGGLPAAATFIIVLGYVTIQWLKNRPVMEQQKISERLSIKAGYIDRIKDLEQAVKDCHEQSDRREKELLEAIDTLKEKINNEAMQRVQSEISLVNTLIQVVPAPELKTVLAALESRQIRMISLRDMELSGAEEKGAE